MPKSKIDTARLTQYFVDNPDQVFDLSDLAFLFIEKAREWNLPPSMTSSTFLEMLLTRTNLRQLRLRPAYSSTLRLFSWGGTASPVSVAIAIMKDQAFFSHASAMWIHGLGDDDKHIFINKEQSEKRRNSGQLSQEAIDRAFQNKQRRSKLTYKYQDATITLLSGKHTGRLEVQLAKTPSGHHVDVTSIERTLIDITVRPLYSGGVPAVLRAFSLAQNRASIAKLLSLFNKFDYTYPYHQAIGFYLKHSGYSDRDQALARSNGIKFDFYLCHALKNPIFDTEWRVYFPRTLKKLLSKRDSMHNVRQVADDASLD